MSEHRNIRFADHAPSWGQKMPEARAHLVIGDSVTGGWVTIEIAEVEYTIFTKHPSQARDWLKLLHERIGATLQATDPVFDERYARPSPDEPPPPQQPYLGMADDEVPF